jgi:hypothetical protein
MTDHRFPVGQHALLDSYPGKGGAGQVEVLDGVPQYRIRAVGEGFERVVKEHQLSIVASARS